MDLFAADRALRGEEMLFRCAKGAPSRRVLRRAAVAAGAAAPVGVGEREEPRAEPAEEDATGGGMERRLRGLERFAGGGFREEAMAVNQIQRLGNEVGEDTR